MKTFLKNFFFHFKQAILYIIAFILLCPILAFCGGIGLFPIALMVFYSAWYLFLLIITIPLAITLGITIVDSLDDKIDVIADALEVW